MDRTTKILLLMIALGLWANVAVRVFQPDIAHAQDTSRTNSVLQDMARDLNSIYNGTCTNSKIC